jgi:hypothetical protein
MGLAAWLNLDGKDVVVFVFAGLAGYFVGRLMPPGWWAIYMSILVSYHLFLAWLVLTADHEVRISLPIVSTITTHLACMVVVVGLGMGRHFVPFFGVFRYGIAGLAIFERGWLFSGNTVHFNEPEVESVSSTSPVLAATGDDYQEWQRHLAQQKRGSRTMGNSLKTEYEQWLLARAQSRSAGASKDGDAAGR